MCQKVQGGGKGKERDGGVISEENTRDVDMGASCQSFKKSTFRDIGVTSREQENSIDHLYY